jgi:hypothetical protein
MIWLTWRQHRGELAIAALFAAAFGAFAVWSGFAAHAAYTDDGIAACLADPTAACGTTVTRFVDRYNDTDNGLIALLLLLLPPVAGMFVGAPLLAREFEGGTWQLAWTQSTPRLRWLAAKLSLVIAGTAVVAAAVSGIYSWWHAPFDRITARFDIVPFEFGIPVFTAHAVFAVAAGALAGTLIRRSVPAMAVTLVVYIAVAFPIATQLRSHYMEPLTASDVERSAGNPFDTWGDWILTDGFVDPSGRYVSVEEVETSRPVEVSFETYVESEDLQLSTRYHPASRYWRFQLTEAAIFLGLAAILLAAVVVQIRRRAG